MREGFTGEGLEPMSTKLQRRAERIELTGREGLPCSVPDGAKETSDTTSGMKPGRFRSAKSFIRTVVMDRYEPGGRSFAAASGFPNGAGGRDKFALHLRPRVQPLVGPIFDDGRDEDPGDDLSRFTSPIREPSERSFRGTPSVSIRQRFQLVQPKLDLVVRHHFNVWQN
jgi:hypothetical protein